MWIFVAWAVGIVAVLAAAYFAWTRARGDEDWSMDEESPSKFASGPSQDDGEDAEGPCDGDKACGAVSMRGMYPCKDPDSKKKCCTYVLKDGEYTKGDCMSKVKWFKRYGVPDKS